MIYESGYETSSKSKGSWPKAGRDFLHALGTHLDELDLGWLRSISGWIRDEF